MTPQAVGVQLLRSFKVQIDTIEEYGEIAGDLL